MTDRTERLDEARAVTHNLVIHGSYGPADDPHGVNTSLNHAGRDAFHYPVAYIRSDSDLLYALDKEVPEYIEEYVLPRVPRGKEGAPVWVTLNNTMSGSDVELLTATVEDFGLTSKSRAEDLRWHFLKNYLEDRHELAHINKRDEVFEDKRGDRAHALLAVLEDVIDSRAGKEKA